MKTITKLLIGVSLLLLTSCSATTYTSTTPDRYYRPYYYSPYYYDYYYSRPQIYYYSIPTVPATPNRGRSGVGRR